MTIDTPQSLALKAPRRPSPRADGRRGDVYSIRLEDQERAALSELFNKARPEMPWRPHRHYSLGAFIVWAAMQWKPAQLPLAPKKPARRRKPAKPRKSRRRGTTGRRRPAGKKGRRS